MSKRIKKNVLFVLVALAIVFVLQNAAPVRTTFFFMTLEMPRALLILVTFLTGCLAGYLATTTGILPGRSKGEPQG